MIPLYDFNVVCCALATFSAAVGYRYSRRTAGPLATGRFDLRSTRAFLFRRHSSASQNSAYTANTFESDSSDCSSDCPTPSESSADVTEPGSLKRKNREDHDEVGHESDNSSDIENASTIALPDNGPPPRKRCRTPTSDDGEKTLHALIEDELPRPVDVACPRDPPSPVVPTTTEVVLQEVTESPAVSVIENLSGPATSCDTSVPVSSSSTLPSSFAIPVYKPSSAFSAFAGSSSGFSSAFISSTANPQRPIWCSDKTSMIGSGASGSVITAQAREHAQDAANGVDTSSISVDDRTTDALAAHKHAAVPSVAITGEEDEDVLSDLKGVKLFVKRGENFSTGMLGHVKLLSHRDTKAERLVFRREPVWKVSMSVGLRPTVRCNYDEEHEILRVTLVEVMGQPDKSTANELQQVVVYALKRGKASKADFAQFARSVTGSTQLGNPPIEVAIS